MDLSKVLPVGMGVVVGGLGLYLYLKNKKESNNNLKTIYLDSCDTNNIIEWFKEKDTLEKLKTNDNYIAIVIKDTHKLSENIPIKKDKKCLMQCIFDEKNDAIIDAQILEYEKLSKEVEDMFKDKDMLVLS